MNAIPYDGPDDGLDDYADTQGELDDYTATQQLPGRPRRRLLTRSSAALFALLAGGIGFFAGVRIEKSHTAAGTSVAGNSSLPSSGGLSSVSSKRSGSAGPPAGLSGSSFAGAPGGSGTGTSGTVNSISGHTLYIESGSGDTIKVILSSATKISKELAVSRNLLRPGDTVLVTGISGADGSIAAATIADSGSSSSASSSASASTS